MNSNDLLDRYADRGTPRGSRAVLAEARAAASAETYATDAEHGTTRRTRVWLAAAVVLMFAAAGAVALWPDADTSVNVGTTSPSAPDTSGPAQTVDGTVFDTLEEQMAWEAGTGLVPVPDETGEGLGGYVRQEDLQSSADRTEPRAIPVYDLDGIQVGVLTDAGFVDMETWNNGDLDIEALILERWGPERLEEYQTEVLPRYNAVAPGWAPVGESDDGQSAYGYWRVEDKLEAAVIAEEVLDVLPVPVYDEPDGEIIGFHLGPLGIVSVEAYEANTDELLDEARAAIVAHEEQTELTNEANADQQRDANGG